jgi:hypothetical protein
MTSVVNVRESPTGEVGPSLDVSISVLGDESHDLFWMSLNV